MGSEGLRYSGFGKGALPCEVAYLGGLPFFSE